MHRSKSRVLAAGLAVVLGGAFAGAALARGPMARAELKPRSGGTESGTVTFEQQGDAVTIVAHIEGAKPGVHGLHVHDKGDCGAPDFTSAGGHFNPAGVGHGCPDRDERHAGDFGSITIGEDGSGHLEMTVTGITVAAGPNSVVGKAVIFHENPDDCTTQPTGNAGGRLACGVFAEHTMEH